jgi:geranylgeranyl reductase family protein
MSYLDFDLPGELIEQDVYGARLHFDGTLIEVKKSYRIAVLVSRTHFDHFLLEKAEEAGARIMQGRRVSALDRDRDCAQVIVGKDSYRGRIVIGSDGFHSVTARYVRRKHRKNEYGICIASRIPGDEVAMDIHDVVDIHFGVAGEGYGWIFPHKGYFSVGIGGSASQLVNPKAVMRRFLASTGLPTDVKMRGFPIPAGGVRRDVVADRLLLTGDAAGFVDAFAGEGIAYAIRSGQLAGEVAAIALKSGSCCVRALDPYRVRCEREFGRDLRYALYSARLMHRFPGLFLRLMASDAEILGRYLEVPARRLSYQKYLAWLLPRIPYCVARLVRS